MTKVIVTLSNTMSGEEEIDLPSSVDSFTINNPKVTTANTPFAVPPGVNFLVRCDPSGGPVQVNLPPLPTDAEAGKEVIVKNDSASPNVITIQPAGTNTIDNGAPGAPITITLAEGVARLIADQFVGNWMSA